MPELSDSISKILDGLSKVAWPILTLVVVWRVYPMLSQIMQSRAFAIKVGDMEISVQEASNQLSKQIQDLQDKVAVLEGRIVPASTPIADGAQTVLWVDDHPDNNAYEIAALREQGTKVITVKSTEEAIQTLSSQWVSAIISDMGRQENGRFNKTAGLELARRVREIASDTPVYFYTTSQARRTFAKEIDDNGAQATSSPVELMAFLKNRAAHRVGEFASETSA